MLVPPHRILTEAEVATAAAAEVAIEAALVGGLPLFGRWQRNR
jgi:hypothetical protein